MEILRIIPEEKWHVFNDTAYQIVKKDLIDDVGIGLTASKEMWQDIKNPSQRFTNAFCDGYVRGMAVAMVLIEEGVLNIQCLEIQKTNEQEQQKPSL